MALGLLLGASLLLSQGMGVPLPALPLPFLLPLALVLLPGAAFAGALAADFRTVRFWKILAVSLCVYVLTAFAAALIMILSDSSPYPPDNALWRKLLGALFLGLTGSVIFLLPASPLLALAAWLLERSTRPDPSDQR